MSSLPSQPQPEIRVQKADITAPAGTTPAVPATEPAIQPIPPQPETGFAQAKATLSHAADVVMDKAAKLGYGLAHAIGGDDDPRLSGTAAVARNDISGTTIDDSTRPLLDEPHSHGTGFAQVKATLSHAADVVKDTAVKVGHGIAHAVGADEPQGQPEKAIYHGKDQLKDAVGLQPSGQPEKAIYQTKEALRDAKDNVEANIAAEPSVLPATTTTTTTSLDAAPQPETAIHNAKGTMSDTGSRVAETIEDASRSAKDTIVDQTHAVKEAVVEAAQESKELISDAGHVTKEALKTLGGGLKHAVGADKPTGQPERAIYDAKEAAKETVGVEPTGQPEKAIYRVKEAFRNANEVAK